MRGLATILMILMLASPLYAGSAIDEINQEVYSPPHPMTEYRYKSNGEWTTWNKVLFGAAIGGQAADAYSTSVKLDEGCSEANPVFGEDPNMGVIVLVKALVIGGAYYLIEYQADDENKETYRNVVYGILGVAGLGTAAYNSTIDCN